MLTIDDGVKQKLREMLSQSTHENKVPWLYRDSLGHLTIGVGHLLLKSENAKARANFKAPLTDLLTYEHETLRASQSFAADYGTFCAARTPSQLGPLEAQGPIISFVKQLTPGRQVDDTVPGPWGLELDKYKKDKAENPELELLIDEAWNVMNHVWTMGSFKGRAGLPYAGRKASDFFECHSTFRLTEQGITGLLNDDIAAKLAELGKYVTQDQISKWPAEAVLAVVDLIYQWGAKGIFDNSKGLNKDLAKAILAQDWASAASNVPSAEGGARTTDRIDLFKKAVPPKPPAKK